ncbi:MAG: EcsC family protein [Gammaproteobacteria bacterium]|nr:EcsC family protein [Gammaproteobacteria bacterium]MBT4081394.1 EcsC family protein [Gammaproteobacteria bacterium]MBT5360841.1 EcsC family protein [Gammaproteobacteria bacterium]MBT5635621.1 EcsC family protein [Gammaproteobacteria bacterium]
MQLEKYHEQETEMLTGEVIESQLEDIAIKKIAHAGSFYTARRVAHNLGKKMVRRKAAQLVPLLGAVVGGTTSTLFIYEVGIAAQRLLQERWFGRDIETEGKP